MDGCFCRDLGLVASSASGREFETKLSQPKLSFLEATRPPLSCSQVLIWWTLSVAPVVNISHVTEVYQTSSHRDSIVAPHSNIVSQYSAGSSHGCGSSSVL